jgi:hypothetical protein
MQFRPGILLRDSQKHLERSGLGSGINQARRDLKVFEVKPPNKTKKRELTHSGVAARLSPASPYQIPCLVSEWLLYSCRPALCASHRATLSAFGSATRKPGFKLVDTRDLPFPAAQVPWLDGNSPHR